MTWISLQSVEMFDCKSNYITWSEHDTFEIIDSSCTCVIGSKYSLKKPKLTLVQWLIRCITISMELFSCPQAETLNSKIRSVTRLFT